MNTDDLDKHELGEMLVGHLESLSEEQQLNCLRIFATIAMGMSHDDMAAVLLLRQEDTLTTIGLNTDRMAAESVIYDAAALCTKQNKMEMQSTGDVH